MPKSIAQNNRRIICWEPPEGADEDWLVGSAATRAERSMTWGASFAAPIGVVVLAAMGRAPTWAWWQVVVVAAVAFDVVGGATYVYLADQAGWVRLMQSGWTENQIIDQVLKHIEPPVSIDDYEVFIGKIRTLPTSVWSERPTM